MNIISSILTKNFLENEYLKKELSVKTISKNTGLSYSYIQSKIKKYDIKRRPQYKNLINEIFDKLTVKNFVGLDHRKQAMWNCLCKCGKYKIIRGNRLTCGEVKNCGCVHKKRYGDISGSHFSNIKAHARWRNLEFKLKIEDIWNLYLRQDKKCVFSGVEIKFDPKIKENTTASLDRIDSSKGYTIDNVQWVHKDINQMKSNRTTDQFLNWIKIIALNHKFL